MLGWHISVFRQADGGSLPAGNDTREGARLAVWQAGLDGIDWLRDLVAVGKAVDLGGNGYPFRFSAPAAHLMPRILEGPPFAHSVWIVPAGSVTTEQWAGRTMIDCEQSAACPPDEWLLVVVWDES